MDRQTDRYTDKDNRQMDRYRQTDSRTDEEKQQNKITTAHTTLAHVQ